MLVGFGYFRPEVETSFLFASPLCYMIEVISVLSTLRLHSISPCGFATIASPTLRNYPSLVWVMFRSLV